ncbi:MAG: TAXI family TRAP transporter solute-binding subunit [Bacteroidetes bacterium]|jgi:TRAP transporter TAXI family solute receptor|nr:TAXI family TRAP transporter solute-binding subunit [Bacteroidota bacterium]MDA9240206.1 TAXI family TRAP transporter solute-binding subunit [bacterium]MDB2399206.1 TAXI family TRAP transporter solute-binding subunit [Planktomarina sp.]
MKLKYLTSLTLVVALGASAVVAELAALGSTARGGTSQIGRTLAAAISEVGELQIRPQELANTADYIPLVNAGDIEFGIANVVQLTYAVNGTGMSEGRPNSNLKMVATLMPFRSAYIVRKDSDIKSVEDLKGRRVPVFADKALGDYVTKGYFANANMSLDQVDGVAVPNFPRMWASFAEGSADVAIVVVGAANSREYDASFGIRYLSFENTPEALARTRKFLPQMYLQEMPAGSVPGIDKPTNVNVFDYTLFAGKDVSDDMVYKSVKALWEKEADLLAAGPFWNGFMKEKMSTPLGLTYHPGAIKFYKEMGVWIE